MLNDKEKIMFTTGGHAVVLFQKLEVGFLAYRTYLVSDPEGNDRPVIDHENHPEYFETLHEKAPTEVIDERVKELKVKESELRRSIQEQGRILREKERSHQQAIKDMESVLNQPGIENIRLFNEGKITHLVELGYRPKIMTMEEHMSKIGDYSKDPHMLSLMVYSQTGCKKLGGVWLRGAYSDGSGSNTEVVPCQSEDEAMSVYYTKYLLEYNGMKSNTNPPRAEHVSVMDVMIEMGVEINKDFYNDCVNEKITNLQKQLASSRTSCERFEAQISEVMKEKI